MSLVFNVVALILSTSYQLHNANAASTTGSTGMASTSTAGVTSTAVLSTTTGNNTNPAGPIVAEETVSSTFKQLAMYFLLPMFVIIYIGCFLVYGFHKSWLYYRFRKQRQSKSDVVEEMIKPEEVKRETTPDLLKPTTSLSNAESQFSDTSDELRFLTSAMSSTGGLPSARKSSRRDARRANRLNRATVSPKETMSVLEEEGIDSIDVEDEVDASNKRKDKRSKSKASSSKDGGNLRKPSAKLSANKDPEGKADRNSSDESKAERNKHKKSKHEKNEVSDENDKHEKKKKKSKDSESESMGGSAVMGEGESKSDGKGEKKKKTKDKGKEEKIKEIDPNHEEQSEKKKKKKKKDS